MKSRGLSLAERSERRVSACLTRIDVPLSMRTQLIDLLNWQLADTFALFSQIKQAHWNVKGMHFMALHELFGSLAEQVEIHIDMIAERAISLGGAAFGTAGVAASKSRLSEFWLGGIDGQAAVDALAEPFALLGQSTRAANKTSSALGDADTGAVFTEVPRGLDKSLWILEAHLQA